MMTVGLRSWWQQIKQHLVTILVVAIILVVVIALIIIGSLFNWTGFKGKTLWDWLQLIGILAIPVVAVVLGVWFTEEQHKRESRQRKKAEENTLLREFRSDIIQAYNAAKGVRRLLRATARYIPPGQREVMIIRAPDNKQMDELIDIQLRFETFKRDVKDDTALFSKMKDRDTLVTDLDSMETYLGDIGKEYEKLFNRLDEKIPLSELDKLKEFIQELAEIESNEESLFRQKFQEPRRRVVRALTDRLISE